MTEKDRPKLILGLVGASGSGKDTVVGQLIQLAKQDGWTAERHGFSDILKETCALWHQPSTTDFLQRIPIALEDSVFGKGALAHAVKTRASQSQADLILFNGMRWPADEEMVRSFPRNLIIYVAAPASIRYHRLTHRGEKPEETSLTEAQFVKQEKVSTETHIPSIGSRADETITNTSTLEHLTGVVNNLYRQRIQPILNQE